MTGQNRRRAVDPRARGRGKPPQGLLEFRSWGGVRKGAGRKPKGEKAGVAHRERPALASRFPVHVTLRLRRGLPSLRRRAERRVLMAAFTASCERAGRLGGGFRLVHYSIQGNHLHLIVEAIDRLHLGRGMQGLSIRMAKRLNRLWGRRGSVFADRYHDHVLRTPREVRNALSYVLHNARRHAVRPGRAAPRGPDVYTSAPWFDGWREHHAFHNLPAQRPTAPPHTWLLHKGWRRHGLLQQDEVPGVL